MSATGVWLQGRPGIAPLSALLVLTPGIPNVVMVLEPAANLLPWLWLHWFGGFGVLPPSANHGGSQGSSGFTEGSRSSFVRGLSH